MGPSSSVPGISHVRANIIVATICSPQRFKTKHQFWGYCMLVRHIQMSGGKIYGPGGAAERLGLKPTTLYGKMRKHHIRKQADSAQFD